MREFSFSTRHFSLFLSRYLSLNNKTFYALYSVLYLVWIKSFSFHNFYSYTLCVDITTLFGYKAKAEQKEVKERNEKRTKCFPLFNDKIFAKKHSMKLQRVKRIKHSNIIEHIIQETRYPSS